MEKYHFVPVIPILFIFAASFLKYSRNLLFVGKYLHFMIWRICHINVSILPFSVIEKGTTESSPVHHESYFYYILDLCLSIKELNVIHIFHAE